MNPLCPVHMLSAEPCDDDCLALRRTFYKAATELESYWATVYADEPDANRAAG